jgi:hypothetical protein
MAEMMEEVKKNRGSGDRAPARSLSPQKGGQTGMLPLWANGTFQEGVPKIFGIAEREETSIFPGN